MKVERQKLSNNLLIDKSRIYELIDKSKENILLKSWQGNLKSDIFCSYYI